MAERSLNVIQSHGLRIFKRCSCGNRPTNSYHILITVIICMWSLSGSAFFLFQRSHSKLESICGLWFDGLCLDWITSCTRDENKDCSPTSDLGYLLTNVLYCVFFSIFLSLYLSLDVNLLKKILPTQGASNISRITKFIFAKL